MPHTHALAGKCSSSSADTSRAHDLNAPDVRSDFEFSSLRKRSEVPLPQGLASPLYSRVCVVSLPVSRGAWTDQRHAWGLRAPRSEPVIAEQLMRDGLTVLEIAGVLEGRR